MMPSNLPTLDSMNRKVKDFGIGTYDSQIQSEYNDEGDFEYHGESIPTVIDGTSLEEIGKFGSSNLPGDMDAPPRQRKKPEDSTITSPVQSVAKSELPCDKNNPSARSDYYDRTSIGNSMLPGHKNNDQSMDMFLKSLGNWWSGWSDTDVSQPMSFPVSDMTPEESDKYTSVPIGASTKTRNRAMNRQATNIDLVGTLTSDFMKKYGKKNLTRRHVMSFLRIGGYHQYLASDVIRCLQHRHGVHVADVLDQFPVSDGRKIASTDSMVSTIKELTRISKRVASVSTSNGLASKTLMAYNDEIIKAIADLVKGLEDV